MTSECTVRSHVMGLLTLIGLLGLGSGCQLLGTMQVETVASTAHRPGQVSVYVSVSDREEDTSGLGPENFKLFEDDNELNASEVQLRLLDRDPVAEHHALVLVDLGGPIEKPGARRLLAKQLTPFVERLRAQQSVSVYGFDGQSRLYPFGDFEKLQPGENTSANVDAELGRLAEHQQKDSSRNLNGAVVTALDQVSANLRRTTKPIRIGSVVVITRGPDLAGRVSADELASRLKSAEHRVYALAVAIDTDAALDLADDLGKNGYEVANRFETMESPLSEIAGRVEADYNRYYLVSYCSPARAGQRTLLLQVTRNDSGGDRQMGETEIEFSSDGFGSDCDSSSVPRFSGGLAASGSAPGAASGSGAQPGAAGQPGDGAGADAAGDAPAEDGSDEAPDDDAEDETLVPPPEGSGYAE